MRMGKGYHVFGTTPVGVAGLVAGACVMVLPPVRVVVWVPRGGAVVVRMPVHRAPKGQHATFPALSAVHWALLAQQRPGAFSSAQAWWLLPQPFTACRRGSWAGMSCGGGARGSGSGCGEASRAASAGVKGEKFGLAMPMYAVAVEKARRADRVCEMRIEGRMVRVLWVEIGGALECVRIGGDVAGSYVSF
jgi:hypothetical protein